MLRDSSVAAKRRCRVCGGDSVLVSGELGVCVDCIRKKPDEVLPFVEGAHASARRLFGLPLKPPRSEGGIACRVCSNECVIGRGEKGFCGLRENRDGRLQVLTSPKGGLLYAYLDPHVTNCCANWFCPAGTGAGYPKFCNRAGPEFGWCNLAVFFYGCNFDCLFCQNASHKEIRQDERVSSEEFVGWVEANDRISCVCFFGGSPEPQLPFALKVSRTLLKANRNRVLRICFEWNGCGNPELVRRAAELALVSGGNIKFDLKCFNPTLSSALSGVSNERAYENFRMIAEGFYGQRPELPLLTAATLLVPSYVDVTEVDRIARFIADLNDEMPYSLLVFYPHFRMRDLPVTPVKQVADCYRTAKRHLKKVNVGNLHLLGMRSLGELEKI